MLYRDYIVLCKVWHDFASQSMISRSKGTSLPLSLSFFPIFWIWKLNRGNTCIKLGRASIIQNSPVWEGEMDERERTKYLGFGPATSPWLSLLTLFTDLASVKLFPSGLNQNWPREKILGEEPRHQRFWLTGPLCSLFWRWTTQLEKFLWLRSNLFHFFYLTLLGR